MIIYFKKGEKNTKAENKKRLIRRIIMRLKRKILSLVLVFIFCFNFIGSAYANTRNNTPDNNQKVTQQDIDNAREVFNSLSEEEKELFELSIQKNNQLMEFHKKYVNAEFSYKKELAESNNLISAYKLNPVDQVTAGLALLAIPVAVQYSLEAVAVGVVASGGGTFLPGDFILAAATVAAGATLAIYWDDVYPLWEDIVDVFKDAFSNSVNAVIEAFSEIFGDAADEADFNVSYRNKVVTVSGEKYYCNTRADYMDLNDRKKHQYYVAVIYKGFVFVDDEHPLQLPVAEGILRANNNMVGIWGTTQENARRAAHASFSDYHNAHNSSEGYFHHYHPKYAKKAHAWFL